MEDKEQQIVDFAFNTGNPHIIKVIGVGGGGGNAVNHMYQTGIHDVSFVVCNTDAQALDDSPVQVKVQLGSEGLGAGNIPEKARQGTLHYETAYKSACTCYEYLHYAFRGYIKSAKMQR